MSNTAVALTKLASCVLLYSHARASQVSKAPRTRDYVLLVPETQQPRYLDPTDAGGRPCAWPGPGLPWPLSVDPLLAFINEPPAGGDVNVCFGGLPRGDPLEVRFMATRQLAMAEGTCPLS